MREIRTYGSEGGVAPKGAIPTPIRGARRGLQRPGPDHQGRGSVMGTTTGRWAAFKAGRRPAHPGAPDDGCSGPGLTAHTSGESS
jgi:hypothetical protein